MLPTATWGWLQPCVLYIYIYISLIYTLHSNKNNACQKGLQFILCIMFFFCSFSALHFIFSDRLTDGEEADEPAKCAPAASPLPYATAATLKGCKSELICLRNQAKVTRRRNCGLHSRSGLGGRVRRG